MKILNFGSLNIDYVYQVEHFVRAGETLSSRGRQIFPGGKGLNQSIALARAGAEVYHAGAVGAEDGAFLRELLADNGVNVKYLRELQGEASGHAVIQVEPSGQNCILLYGGTNQAIAREQVDETLDGFAAGDFLLLQNEINQMPYIMEQAAAKGMKIVLNPSPMDETIFKMPLETVDCFILNEVEAGGLCPDTETDMLLERLAQMYPAGQIVLTLGEAGSCWHGEGSRHFQSIYRVDAVDTTGAGDTFTGYFLASRMAGREVSESLDLAAAASAITVSREGASPSIPTMEEVLARMPELKGQGTSHL